MRYLLIDFGASFIKCVEYDSETGGYFNQSRQPSPFKRSPSITKQELRVLLHGLLLEHRTVGGILVCTILGGFYDGDTYHSWKSRTRGTPTSCMIGGLFIDEPTFHIHEHHARFFQIEDCETELKVIGYVDNIPVYSPLGDTDCVMHSVYLDEHGVIINMGTGSQVLKKDERKSFIPSGRALLTFADFFGELGIDMFDYMANISLEDINKTSLHVNLNVFPESHQYDGGGYITGIHEGDFNLKNLTGSILRSYVDQYDGFISDERYSHIILTGGIPKKLPVIREYLSYKYSTKQVIIDNHPIENTHRGMVKYIQEFL